MKISVLILALFLAAATVRAQESYGTIKSTTKLHNDGSSSTTVVDPEKRTAEETLRDAKGKVVRTTTYILGEGDLAIGAVFSDPKGNVIYKASYQRDGMGRVIEASFTNPDGVYLGKRLFDFTGGPTARVEDYDAKGVLISRPIPVGKPVSKGAFKRP